MPDESGQARQAGASSSQRKHPCGRMFALPGNAFVLIGWPPANVMNSISKSPLDRIRREMNNANIWHYYHRSAADIDNDLHLVLGRLDGPSRLNAEGTAQAQRDHMADHPLYVEIGADQVSVVAASTPTLAAPSFVGGLSSGPERLAALYR